MLTDTEKRWIYSAFLSVLLHLRGSVTGTIYQRERYADLGSVMTLFCDHGYNTTGILTWEGPPPVAVNTSDGQVTVDPMGKALQEGRLELTNHNRELIIKNVSIIDAGDYRCTGSDFPPITFHLRIDAPGSINNDDDSTLSSDKTCYLPGEQMKLTAIYRGFGNVTFLYWFYSEEVRANIVVDAHICVDLTYDIGFPDGIRFDCFIPNQRQSQMFTLTVNNIKEKDLDTLWGLRMAINNRLFTEYDFLYIEKCSATEMPEIIVG